MTIHAERSAFALAIVLMGTGVLSADTISTTNVEFNITTPTVFNGVTNVYTYGTGSGTISANMTLENHAYVRLTGSMSSSSTTLLLIAPDANDVMIDISGQSGFFTTYRNSNSPASWTATGVAPNNTSLANSYMACRIGTRDGAADSTGTAQIRVSDNLDNTFGTMCFGALWMESLTVESSVSAGPSGYIDFLKLDNDCSADIGTIFVRNTHHPTRILFNGGRYFSNNASRRQSYSLYPVAGATLILESMNGAVINLHKQFGSSYLSGGLGGTVIFRGNCDVRLGSTGDHLKTPGDANFYPWYLGAYGGYEDTIVWEHTGNLRLEGNCWLQCNRNDKLPYGPGKGGIYIAGNSATIYSFLDLNGTTQRVNSITSQIASGNKLYACVSNCDTTATSLLRFGTCNDDGVLQARCCANVAATKEGSGLLRIRGTTLEDFTALEGSILVGESSFSNITVAAGVQALGEMTVNGTLSFTGENANYDFSHVAVALGAEGNIAVPADATLTVLALTRGDTGILAGTYAADGTDWLTSGTVRVLLTAGAAATDVSWTGVGETESAALAANWSAAVNLTDGSVRPVFADAGSRAIFEAGQYAFGGLTFSAPGDFTLADGGGAQAQLFGPIEIAEGDGTARHYTVDVPLAIHAAQTIAVPTNKTLALSGGLDGYDSCAITLTGVKMSSLANDWEGGTLVLSNAIYSGALTHNMGGTLVIQGQLGKPGDNQALTLYNGDYRNPSDSSTWAELGNTTLDNATIYKPVTIGSRGQVKSATNTRTWLRTTPGSTTVFKNTVKQSASICMALESNSTVIFEKGYSEVTSGRSGSVNLGTMGTGRTNCTYIFKGPLVHLTSSKEVSPSNGSTTEGGLTYVFATNGNKCVNYWVGLSTLDFRCDYALDVSNLMYMNSSSGAGTLKLNGTKQRIPTLYTVNNAAKNHVTGTADAVLEITRGVANETQAANTNFSAIVKGGASLAMTGTGYFRMRAVTHTSTGTLSVSSGTLALDAGCVWNGAQVVASGTGTLKIGSGGTFGEKTVFAAEGDAWTFDIPSGVSQRVSMFLLDGKPQKSGTWGAIGSGAKYESARFTGGGFLAVRRLGTSLTLR